MSNIRLFESKKIRSAWNEDEENWGTICPLVEMTAADGRSLNSGRESKANHLL